ncbi:MAG: zinc ribbon domain-containing protein [Chloroflexi bacterium]|nr:zinc ribbon domain-containing protein [Chloroflexota bacterium]
MKAPIRRLVCSKCGKGNFGIQTHCVHCQAPLPPFEMPHLQESSHLSTDISLPPTIAASSPTVNKCSSCGIDNNAEAQFCKNCGVKLALQPLPESSTTAKPAFCSKCGSALKPEQNFCVKCGYHV